MEVEEALSWERWEGTDQWYFTFFVTIPAVKTCVGVPCSVISLYLLVMLFGNLLRTHTIFCYRLALGLVLNYVYSTVALDAVLKVSLTGNLLLCTSSQHWYWKYVL